MPGWLSRAIITLVMAWPAGMAGVAQRDPLSHRSGPHPPPPKRAWCCPSPKIPAGAFPRKPPSLMRVGRDHDAQQQRPVRGT
jgi:hypothetical protein